MAAKKPPRLITAYLELPQDGSMKALRVYVKSSDGKDLTYQAVLDAVSDCLIDDACFSEFGEEDLSDKWDS